MPNSNNITTYVQNFLYTVSRPHLADALLSSVDVEKLVHADVTTKLMSLGAMLHSGDCSKWIQLVTHLDFKEIPRDERSLLVLIIFTKFNEYGLVDINRANFLKHILTAICPEALLAHTESNEPISSPLITLDYCRDIRSSVKGAIFVGEFVFGPNSRKSEIGYRIKKAISSQGWAVSLLPIQEVHHYSSPEKNDFALIDVFTFHNMAPDNICSVLSRLRNYFRKIILFDVDVWAGRFDSMLQAISGHVDYIWGFTADWKLTGEQCFQGRSIAFPYFGGFDHLSTIIDATLDWNTCSFNFTGSVQSYNINRIYWILEFMHRNVPIEVNITHPLVDDGLEPDQSQQQYAQEVATTHAAINLISRGDGSRPATGRSFEVPSLNRLLIQESCPVFHRYFVEGEHFFEFSDIEQLSTIIEFLRSHPKTAQTICSQGHQFYREHYSCRKLVEHLQTIL